jgi:hypothetical protein
MLSVCFGPLADAIAGAIYMTMGVDHQPNVAALEN